MAGLSEGEIDEILSLLLDLNRSGVAIIMIEHIMHAVMRWNASSVSRRDGSSPRRAAGHRRESKVQRVYFGEQARR